MSSWFLRLEGNICLMRLKSCRVALPATTKVIQSKIASHLAYYNSLFKRPPVFLCLAQMSYSTYTADFHAVHMVQCYSDMLFVHLTQV